MFIFFFHNVLWKNDIYIYDDYMLCKVTLGVLKGASKLYVLLLGVKQLCCETTYCFCTNSYYWVSSNYVARQPIVFVQILIIGCQATMLRDNLLFSYEFLLLGVKQLCCETTHCFRTNSYYWVSSNYVARQPIVFVWILIIGCQATMLRDNLLFSYEFLLLLLLLCCHWSQWQPIEPLGEKLWNLAQWFRTAPLAH